jgi:energy-coupling factor transporter ATP-binding protein EcfA2
MSAAMSSEQESLVPSGHFVGIGVGLYDDETHFAPLPKAVADVRGVASQLEKFQFSNQIIENPTWQEVLEALTVIGRRSLSAENSLVMLWAGHGLPVAEGLHLITKNVHFDDGPNVTTTKVVGEAVRSQASQILILLDTCHAGAGAVSAIELAERIKAELPDSGAACWIGILPSARAYERALDGSFGAQLMRLLERGPTDPELKLRWSAHNAGVRGDDVIIKEWGEHNQAPVPFLVLWGNALPMLPNPLHQPEAPERLVEQLLQAARGVAPDEEGDYFTGRVTPLGELVGWIQRGEPGVAVVTGPAGCGKSALLGRLAALSDPDQRRRVLDSGPLDHADPGEGAVAALAQARALTPDGLAERLDGQLVRAGLLAANPEPRNGIELQGALQRRRRSGQPPPLLLIDGLEEAGPAAAAIAAEVLMPLAGVARVLLSSRTIPSRSEEPPLLESLIAALWIDLGEVELQAETQDDVARYVNRRLEGIAAAMDSAQVGQEILRLSRSQEEGAFLLARLISSELRERPIATDQPGWQRRLAGSVEEALGREIDQLPPLEREGQALPQAARELLSALAWAYGSGFPDDLWPLAATALSPTATSYTRDDVYWLLTKASRWVVEAGEDGRAVYRLAHQRLADHLRPGAWTSPWKPVGEPAAVALASALGDALRTWIRSGKAPQERPYLWRFFWQHAVDAGETGMAILRELAAANPAFRGDLASSLNNLGIRYSELGRRAEALPPSEEAVAIYRELAAANPAFRGDLARSLNNLGIRYSALGRRAEALLPTEEAVAIRRELAAANPAFRNDLASSLTNLGNRYSELGRRAEALPPTEEAVAITRELAAANPGAVRLPQ